MLGFRFKALTVARSVARCCTNVAPAISESNHRAEKSVNQFNFTVSYLADTCGFTKEAARIAAKKVNLKSTEKADKVLSLLREYGFKEGELFRLLEKCPRLIVAKPETSLRPKLDLLASLVPSQDSLVAVLIRCPEMLRSSVNRTLVPSLEFLRGILGSDENVLTAMSRCHWLLRYKLPSLLGPNVAILREVGVPDDLISVFLKEKPGAFLKSAARIRVLVNRAREIGFDPKRRRFIEATCILAGMRDDTWVKKVEHYKKWGWSDDEVIYAFKKCPQCMMTSETKVDALMNYFVNTFKLDSSFVAKNSKLVTYSLRKRIIPRCSIIRYLLSKGVLGMKDFTLNQAFNESENNFFWRFVLKYEKTLPELCELYTQYKNGAASGICQPLCSRDILKPSNNV